MNSQVKKILALIISLLIFVPIFVFASADSVGHVGSFFAGFLHPLIGLDHAIAMVAVGLYAAQLGGKAKWLLPLSFVSLMIIGGAFGLSGMSIPLIEIGIITSIVALGALIFYSIKVPTYVSSIIVCIFALFHGHAHGTEMPLAGIALFYMLGFSFSTLVLHAVGYFAMSTFKSWKSQKTLSGIKF